MNNTRALFLSGIIAFGMPVMASASDFKSLIQEIDEMEMPDTIPYSFLMTVKMDNIKGKDEIETTIGQYRFTPSAEPGARVSIVGDGWEDMPKEMRQELQKSNLETSEAEFAEEFWCTGDQKTHRILTSDEASVIREDAGEAVVALSPDAIADILTNPNEDREERTMPKKIRKRMLAELTFSKPDLRLKQSRFWLSKPTTVKLIAKMHNMDFQETCALAPNGLPYVQENKTIIAGKAMGKSFGATVTLTVSDLQPVQEP